MRIREPCLNYEAVAVLYDGQLTQQLEQDFLDDIEQCQEFDLEDYQNRNVLLRLRDSVARLFSPFM